MKPSDSLAIEANPRRGLRATIVQAVDSKMGEKPPLLLDALRQKFPWTSSIPLNVIDSTPTGDKSGADRKLEFYPPDESENPQPGNPTVEVFDKSMGPADLMGEILSHHLPSVDPKIAAFRQQIITSMTPAQIKGIRGDYENEQRSGLTEGEPFEAWLNKQGGDSFFRGYPTGQWDAKEYTPAQLAIYSKLQSYLNSLPTRMGGANPK